MLNPVLVKELRSSSRRWALYAGRVSYVALVGLVLGSFYNSFHRRMEWMSYSETATLGRELFNTFIVFQFLFVTFTGITAGSDLVARELRGGTLGLLALTPLSAFRIAFGKFQAALTQSATVILCGLPVLAICNYLGGIRAGDLLWTTSLSIACGAIGSGLALLFSTWARRGAANTVSALGAVILYLLLPALFAALADRHDEDLWTLLVHVHPMYAAGTTGMNRFLGGRFEWAWLSATLSAFLQAALLIHFTALRIRTLVERSVDGSKGAKPFEAMDRFYEKVEPKALKKIRIFAGTKRVWDREPLLWKELRTSAAGSFRTAVRAALIGLILLILPLSCMFTNASERDVTLIVGLWVGAISLLLRSAAAGVNAFSLEKEERKWDILLTTPLSAAEILFAKLAANLVGLVPIAGLLGLFWTFVCLAFSGGPLGWAFVVLVAALPCGLAYAVGALASLKATTTRAASTIAFATVLAAYFLLPLIAVLVLEILRFGRGSRWLHPEDLIALISPAIYLGEASEWIAEQVRDRGYRRTLTDELFKKDRAGQAAAYVFLHGTIIAGVLGSLYASLRRLGNRR